MPTTPFTLIGPGAVGRALTLQMTRSGYRLEAVIGLDSPADRAFAKRMGALWSKAPGQVPAGTRLILICTPDREIEKVARQLARQDLPWKQLAALHVSGFRDPACLSPLEKLGAGVGACHPFQTFPAGGRHSEPKLMTARARNIFEGVTFGIDGNARGLRAARKLARDLGGKPLTVSGQQRVLYHLAAVLACGQVATSLLMAQKVLCGLGHSEQRALEAILPISSETLSNIKELGVRAALTGPAARGDKETIRRHLHELKKLDPELAKAYREISKWVMGTRSK